MIAREKDNIKYGLRTTLSFFIHTICSSCIYTLWFQGVPVLGTPLPSGNSFSDLC